MIRTLRLPLAVLALALPALSSTAQAQFSVYADVTVEQLSGIKSSPVLNVLTPLPCTATTTTNCTAYNNSVHPIGFTGGGSYDWKTFGPATIGFDLRGIVESDKRGAQTNATGSGARIYSGLGGVRASFNTPFKLIRPYVQGSVGYARSNYGVLTNAMVSTSPIFPGIPTQNNLEYHAYAGMDLRFLPWADWRIFEAGYGGLQAFGTYAHTYPLYSISSGIVFHIPPRQ
jgi:hypothetical protein